MRLARVGLAIHVSWVVVDNPFCDSRDFPGALVFLPLGVHGRGGRAAGQNVGKIRVKVEEKLGRSGKKTLMCKKDANVKK